VALRIPSAHRHKRGMAVVDCPGFKVGIALPEEHEEIDPSFQHFDSADLPVVDTKGLWARVVAGSVYGKRSRVGRSAMKPPAH
jgi:redox-sensitive bicupin YhaK (pirin superfamily)